MSKPLPLFDPMPTQEVRRAQSWRDRTEVHPASEMFRMLFGEDLAALGKDIAEYGQQQAVVLWTPERMGLTPPTKVYLSDGRMAAVELAFADDPKRCAEVIGRLSCDPNQAGGG